MNDPRKLAARRAALKPSESTSTTLVIQRINTLLDLCESLPKTGLAQTQVADIIFCNWFQSNAEIKESLEQMIAEIHALIPAKTTYGAP